jgi:hypothetical protein
MLRIELDDDPSGSDERARLFSPGQVLTGRVSWSEPKAPGQVRMELAWATIGKGTTDSRVTHAWECEAPLPEGQASFSLTLPRGPLSYRGRLMSIEWELRGWLGARPSGLLGLIAIAGEEPARLPLVISWSDSPLSGEDLPLEVELRGWTDRLSKS